ncbi:hypothetical protein FJZ36_12345 [Candidatus Poribacteria bacterium]|nr:hypothetical protein [Candidatus Poribacteria bacterium]
MTTTDERLLVLNLLREGKLTTEDAERLLRALNAPEAEKARASKPKDLDAVLRQFGTDLGKIGTAKWVREIQSAATELGKQIEAFARDVRHTVSESRSPNCCEYGVSTGAVVRISQKGGSLALHPGDATRVRVSGPNTHAEVDEDGLLARVEGVGGPTVVRIPTVARRVIVELTGGGLAVKGLTLDELTARVVGGGMSIGDVAGSLELETVGAGLELTAIQSEAIHAKAHGGGIRASIGDVTRGEVELSAAGGGIDLELGEASDFEVHYSVVGGGFDSQWEGGAVGENRYRYGSGAATIELSAMGGGISLRKRRTDTSG